MNFSRRGVLAGLAAALAAPAIIRTSGLLMPVKRPLRSTIHFTITQGTTITLPKDAAEGQVHCIINRGNGPLFIHHAALMNEYLKDVTFDPSAIMIYVGGTWRKLV